MGDINHQARAHALLSASGASRWMSCAPSARLEENFKESTSKFASEGTLAHEFGELGLLLFIDKITTDEYHKKRAELEKDPLFSEEMHIEVEKYLDYVIEMYHVTRRTTPDAKLIIEERVDLRDFIEDGFGTCDANIIGNGTLEVIDLKYGKGIKVDADDNPQLKLYGLGALKAYDMLYDIKTVRLTIVQPRLDHISSWDIGVEDLLAWGTNEVIPAAKKAYSGEGEQVAGPHCRWCKAKARCRALADQNLAVAQHDFKEPSLLSDAELIKVYAQIPNIQDWANAVGAFMLKEAIDGKAWEGLKLVEGRSNRKWSDEEKVKKALLDDDVSVETITTTKLNALGKVEKLLGKKLFNSLLSEYIIKPQGAPKLVDQSDKRAALGSDSAAEDFKC